MGSKGLWAFLQPAFKRVSLSKLKNKRILLDIILYLHKQIIGIRNKGSDIYNSNNKNINHLISLYNVIKHLISNNILPICVFDGKPPIQKKQTIEKRKATVEKSKKIVESITKQINEKINITKKDINKEVIKDIPENWEDILLDDEGIDTIYEENEKDNELYCDKNKIDLEYIKHFKKSFNINSNEIKDCKYFLELMGLPFIESYEEADKECAIIYNKFKYLISGIMTEDSDILLFGGSCIYKDFDFTSETVNELNLDDILKFLNDKANKIKPIKFTLDNLIDFSIILGNDYTNGIRVKTVLPEINTYNKSNLSNAREIMFNHFIESDCNIDTLLLKLYKLNEQQILYYIPINFKETFDITKQIYKYTNQKVIDNNYYMKKPKTNELIKYVSDNKLMNKYTITNFITKLNRLYEKNKTLSQQNYNVYNVYNIYVDYTSSSNLYHDKSRDINYNNDNDNNEDEWILVTKK